MRDDLYMITCAARTGSSLLETSLLSHPEIMSHGEVYHADRIGSLRGYYGAQVTDTEQNAALTRFRDANQTAFLYKYVYDAQGKKAVGHKLKHEELMMAKFAETREAVRRDTDIKIIHLSRINLFERFVSWWMAAKVTGVTEIHSDADRPEVTAAEIPAAACRENFDQVTARYGFFQTLFKDHPIFEVTYEDLNSPRRDAVLAEIQAFLGVEARPLESRLKKVNVKRMRDLVSNYDALKEAFADSPYHAFFTE